MGPECVHQVGINQTNNVLDRTFLKVTFSRQILNREGNGINALFDVNWPMFPRNADKRNHSNIVAGYYPYDHQHRLISQEELKKYAGGLMAIAGKVTPVRAYLATPGELLKTVSKDLLQLLMWPNQATER